MGSTFRELAEKCSVSGLQEIYKIIAAHLGEGVQDGAKQIMHSPDELSDIRTLLRMEVEAGFARDHIQWQTMTECRKDMQKRMKSSIVRMTRDGFYNPMTGLGTDIDPAIYNSAYTPVSMPPEEATAVYSSGGLPQRIIDKKAKGSLINGYGFSGEGWTTDECNKMVDYAENIGFGQQQRAGLRDALIYGGSILYPKLREDTPISYGQTIDQLIKAGILKKDSIEFFVTTDRWNVVLVPNWNVTAYDYIYPSEFYVPIGGVRVATARSALIRPKMLPFWGAIRQIGWGVSDFEGYIPSLLAYEVMMRTLPIMFQQMSLLFQSLPLDGNLAQNGPETVEEMMKKNEEKLREFSMLRPKAISMAGSLQVVERHYENVDALFTMQKEDIASKCGIPVSVLWAASPTGLSDSREEDVELKQSEAIQAISAEVAPSMRRVAQMIAVSCFGPTPEVLKKLGKLSLTYDTPVVQTAEKRADAATKFATAVSGLAGAQIPTDAAVELVLLFFEELDVPKEIMDRIRQIPETLPPGSEYEPLEAIETVLERVKEVAGVSAGSAVGSMEEVLAGLKSVGGKN